MVGSQVVYGTLFTALAAWQLRPAFRRHEGREGRQTRSARLARRWFPVRPCGDDPVFWKEAFFSGAVGGLGRKIVRAILIGLLVLAVLGTLAGSRFAFWELREHGYGWDNEGSYAQRLMLNIGLRYGCALVTGIWLLWLASQTAAGISSEREQDTWTGLLATPLERSENPARQDAGTFACDRSLRCHPGRALDHWLRRGGGPPAGLAQCASWWC